MRVDLGPRTWPELAARRDFALALLVYFVLALAVLVLLRASGAAPGLWLADGAAVALAVSAPRTRQPLLLVAVALAGMAAHLLVGQPPVVALAQMLSHLVVVASGTWFVRTSGGAEPFASDHRVLIRILLVAGLAAPLAGATLAAPLLAQLGLGSAATLWSHGVVGGAVGAAATLPLVLSWRARGAAAPRLHLAPAWQALVPVLMMPLMLLILHEVFAPFAALSLLLLTGAFLLPRVLTFLNGFLLVCSIAVGLGFQLYNPRVMPAEVGPLQVYFAVLLVLLPAQVVAVVAARQRAFATMLGAVGSRAEDILVFADMGGHYRWVSRAHSAYWGIPDERALGRPWNQNLPPAALDLIGPMVEQARAGTFAHGLLDIDFPARGRRSVDVAVEPARDDEGHRIGVLLRATDVTELEASRREFRSLTEQLRASNESLEQFVRIASHDLREPLNTIDQFCGLIASAHQHELSPDSKLYFDHVRQGARRMKALLDDVLRFVHVDAAQAPALVDTALDEVLARALAALRSRIDARAAAVRVDGPLGRVWAAPGLLELALQNLVSNAIKFTPPERRPQVTVSARREDGAVRVTVQDNGIGIEAAHLGEIGRPFRRLHSRRLFDGTGLGLAICRRIAEHHGGRLEIESEPGVGSRFHLVLRAAP